MENDYAEIPEYIKKLIESGEQMDEIRLDKEGNWIHNGEPFTNKNIINFFNKSIDVTKDGQYVIHYSHFVYPIIVEDAPVFITGVRFDGFGEMEKVYITINSGEEEILDLKTLHYIRENSLYCYVKNGKLLAKFKRSPFYQMLDRLEESDDTFYLKIAGEKIVLSEKLE